MGSKVNSMLFSILLFLGGVQLFDKDQQNSFPALFKGFVSVYYFYRFVHGFQC